MKYYKKIRPHKAVAIFCTLCIKVTNGTKRGSRKSKLTLSAYIFFRSKLVSWSQKLDSRRKWTNISELSSQCSQVANRLDCSLNFGKFMKRYTHIFLMFFFFLENCNFSNKQFNIVLTQAQEIVIALLCFRNIFFVESH